MTHAERQAISAAYLKKSELHPGTWKQVSDKVWQAPICQDIPSNEWKGHLWWMPLRKGLSKVVPGWIINKGAWVWIGSGVTLPDSQLARMDEWGWKIDKRQLTGLIEHSWRRVWCWKRMGFSEGDGAVLGRASAKYLALPNEKAFKFRHGPMWMAREPIEKRGLTMEEGFREVVGAEWVRRWDKRSEVERARAIARLHDWWIWRWPVPQVLWLQTKKGGSDDSRTMG